MVYAALMLTFWLMHAQVPIVNLLPAWREKPSQEVICHRPESACARRSRRCTENGDLGVVCEQEIVSEAKGPMLAA